MAISGQQVPKCSSFEMKESCSDTKKSNSDLKSEWDDSEEDPDYEILEETHGKLSNLSIKKKTNGRVIEGKGLITEADPEEPEIIAPALDEKDKKKFDQVQKSITAGLIEKLKVDEFKLYLRKNGLRLTGNKDILIQRIMEHQEIINGGGEKKYPPSSFVLNCKGDACTGDVVLFEQNVYEMFNLASRNASGPPCGKRTVAGRIVRESYGSAKQQHTFTIEVLWSNGEKPLPPLHPLLIKGRNLYRLKTLRQKWDDEGERQKILIEKHTRGSLARADREARIQEKEQKKTILKNRVSNRSQSQTHSYMTKSQYEQPQEADQLINSAKPAVPSQTSDLPYLGKRPSLVAGKPAAAVTQHCVKTVDTKRMAMGPQHQASQGSLNCTSYDPYYDTRRAELSENNNWPNIAGRTHHTHKQPFTSTNQFLPLKPRRTQKQPCRHYAKGRCSYGENCKFLHDLRDQIIVFGEKERNGGCQPHYPT